MAQRPITDTAAFHLLRPASQHTHRKLRDIADEVVLTAALPEE
jgi:AmiR/NasT family two-component response regulator